ncbi:integrase arm-type DNA-binding domain-containing protein [Novosphingobium sp. TH158]|uniref:tyrosine-type recombinase/integrase n=1 Tax=Novosphingobium sp. TH158 TaxID=2067455 RepID=UPI000C7B8831|nr:integrase arm-type DNA-binding domain-containing protein [Novosphingobium sp. TH158]PLK25453.1 integrase [Novosphingobium sp. TH158]
MALTDISIRALVHGNKPIKKADEKGLFLLLQPSGGKLWRFKYRFNGKEKKLGLGRYPDVSLKEARRRRDEARQTLAMGTDPGEEKKQVALAAALNASNSFEAVGNEYLEKMSRDKREAVTINKSKWLLSLMIPAIGHRPIADLTPAELLKAFQAIEAKGHLETARRMRSLASRVFRYAVATSRASSDPTALLRGALASPKVKHHSAIIEPKAVGQLLNAIEEFTGYPLTALALKLTPHVFVRPGELRRAEWTEFDLDAATWTIPAEKMKMRQPHVVPLSRQAVAILKSAQVLSSRQKYVFSSLHTGLRPMSENTINAALRRLGYSNSDMTAHGFRAMASTLLNESGKWNPDAIERALAHDTSNSVRGTYHRGQHWDERVRMAQWWSDHLDELKIQASAHSSKIL